jgi:serine/threonine-protein kinase
MGEVYRADDLKLGQAVALKLLPERLADDPERLEYFHNEVRLARQVSHPNVCRVYDIGEVDGQHYLSMEYVDGEDLATLIRRIGRLPPDKGVDIARQLCAGLAAAHDRGVLHRDLKPANVMLDGRGRVRITDFGLARLADEKGGTGVAAGTPAYMAPEQWAGQEVTELSDIYSLGLLLFEVFTGKPVFKADTPAELARLREDSTPSTPSNIVADIDPAVERVILQCLEKEPRERPKSALAVSAALPGGDPLAAALAAGETPSPEMVAAAGESGRLDPRVAFAWLAALLLGLVVAALLADKATVVGNAGLSEKPDWLEKKARDVIDDLDYDTLPKDSAYGFQYDTEYLRSLGTEGGASSPGETGKRGRPPGMHFWYRQSPDYLVPVARSAWVVSADDPPPTRPGMIGVRLNPNGDLVEFYAVPGESYKQSHEPEDAGWERPFKLAGLDLGQFVDQEGEEPMGSTPAFADRRIAWERTHPKGESVVHVEAASCHGKPVYFRVVEACPKPERMPLGIPPSDRQPSKVEEIRAVDWTFTLIVLLAAALLTRRSLRLGRSDRKGAFRLGLFILSFNLLAWLFEASHVPRFTGELALVLSGLLYAVFFAVYFGLMYLAFEPYIRRFWPTLLVSWNRLLTGRFRDPSVGRDLLVGATVGVCFWPVLRFLTVLAPNWLGPAQPVWRTLPSTLLGGRHLLAVTLFYLCSVGVSLLLLLILLLLRMLLRKWWLWAPAFVVLGMAAYGSFAVGSLAPWVTAALWTSLLLLYTRLGLLAAIACLFASYMLYSFPITADLHAWYWGSSLYALTVVAALGVYGFYISTTGRPLLGDRLART